MTSKRHNSYGGVNYSKNYTKGTVRERNQRQGQRTQESTTTESRAIQLLRRVFEDEDDTAFNHRMNIANQLLKLLEDSRSTLSDSLPFRQEQMQLLDICLNDNGLRQVIEMSKAPNALRHTLAKIISGLACFTRLDLVLSWIFTNLSVWLDPEAPISELNKENEWKKWLLRLLNLVLADSLADQYTYRQTFEMSPTILDGIISFLETMNSSDYLPSIIEILTIFAESYKEVFAQRFRDIIDLLVGWNMDLPITDNKRAFILAAYGKFELFWASNLPFAVELLCHFLNDMQNITDELTQYNNNVMEEYDRQTSMCLNLFSCYHAILNTIIPIVTKSELYRDQNIVENIFDSLIPGTIKLVADVLHIKPSDDWIDISKDTLLLFASYNPIRYRQYQYGLYTYLGDQLRDVLITNPLEYLELLMKFLDYWKADIDENIVSKLLDINNSILYEIRNNNRDNDTINNAILVFLRHLIRVNIPIKQREVLFKEYKNTFRQVHLRIDKMYSSNNDSLPLRRTKQMIDESILNPEINPAVESTSSKHVKEDALFYTYLILDMITSWTSFHQEGALLVSDYLNMIWIHECSDLVDNCLQFLKNYWSSFKPSEFSEFDTKLVGSIVTDLTENWLNINLCSRHLLCDFSQNILKIIYAIEDHEFDPLSFSKPIISGFLSAASVEKNAEMVVNIIQLLIYYCRVFGSAEFVDEILQYCQRSINHSHSDVRHATQELLTVLNPFITSELNETDDNVINSIRNIIMATPHTGSFRPIHYEIVMKHLGMANKLIGSEESTEDLDISKENHIEWARRLFHHCDAFSNMKNVPMFTDLQEIMGTGTIVNLINNNEPLLSYWTMWESARYCMLSRLRTPFGGPQQTFAAFERMLNSLVNNANLQENNGENLIYLRRLLILLDCLELQITNATDGCATNTMPSVPRPSIVFFRTNKKTCHDYFFRIRPDIIKGAKIVRDNHALITHIKRLLSELQANISPTTDFSAWFMDVNQYLCDMIEACIHEKYTDMIHGMHAWYRKLLKKISQISPDFSEKNHFYGLIGPFTVTNTSESNIPSWFQIAALFSSSKHESAIDSLNSLRSHLPKDNSDIIIMLNRQAIDFFSSLANYKDMETLLNYNESAVNKFIAENLKAVNDENFPQDRVNELFKFHDIISSAPIESCLQIARLDNSQITASHTLKMDSIITNELCSRLTGVLKDGIYKNIPTLIELQLLQADWDDLLASANDWISISYNNPQGRLPHESKEWARLSNYFEFLKVNNVYEQSKEASKSLGNILLHCAKIARREGNMMLAEKFITKSLAINEPKYTSLYEKSKLLFAQSNYKQSMDLLSEVIVNVAAVPGFEKLESNAYLKVARYLKNCPENEIALLLRKLRDGVIQAEGTELQSVLEVSIEYVLQKSIDTNSMDGRPWYEYASHQYKQGWRILEELTKSESNMTIVSWISKRIRDNLKDLDSISDKASTERAILNLFSKQFSSIGGNTISSNQTFISHLRQLAPSLNHWNELNILTSLDTLYKSVIHKFSSSAQAYFRYLSLDIHNESSDSTDYISSTSMIITATLRIIRILTKYGDALKEIYNSNIETVRIDLLKKITPQLFAQLNHPAEFVRQVISKLISRICDAYPREIIYDVIVSSTSSKTSGDTKQCLNEIAGKMMANNELLWVSTRRMAEELEKITVLFEEKWLNKIASLQSDVMQQFSKLDQEATRLENSNLAKPQREKSFFEIYDSVMKFTIASIDKSLKETSIDSISSTPHEQWFERTYGKQLLHAFTLLQKPTSVKDYRQGWECFQQIHRQLMGEGHKVHILELSKVSPYLASLKRTAIGIPGHHENDDSCFIDTFGSSVIILPTKTKPKKLDLKGTDGRKYSYLFKGLEDLHLDERIMQLLTTTNGLLNENDTTSLGGMRARTYAVIPLSDHSGMIQWVNEATPLFALFKKWQKKESAAHLLLTNDKPNEAIMRPFIQRPPENFTSKMTAALKQAGLKVTANRRYWPKDILKKAYLELLKETPGDLLEKEIYYSSSNAIEWFKKSSSYARSLAVTSMIGYIIGLGDRHLDNMMIDFRSGEVIHIDYNVCFEKGKRLRVPELVPYRLTQNLYNALGITGVDGQFRSAAEETLRVLRKYKEVLITLLDAFVYDPLVDWESEAVEAGYRQMMELQGNLGLIATRISEKQQQHDKDYANILNSISQLRESLDEWQQSMLLMTESLNEDVESEEDDQLLNANETLKGTHNSGQPESESSFMGRLPLYLLREVKNRLSEVTLLLSQSKSPMEGLSSLLESIIIIEIDADNELRPAQKSAKTASDALTAMSNELRKLDLQLIENQNYESEWTFKQLFDLIDVICKSVDDFYSSLKVLEEFGPESNKSSVPPTEEPKSIVDNVAKSGELEELEYSEDNALDNKERYNQSNTNQGSLHNDKENGASQGTNVNKTTRNNGHVNRIMKRIRSKLEGIDFGIQHKMSISEQVNKSIDEATSTDNLCLMYEGWTSWV
ncbi:hypothetical protein BDB01DRAFT_798216 [Pilobolus umbonatus]|nr:hypothetical protein BDB01DRAFT_798216 [Pilobolus umbonatus]